MAYVIDVELLVECSDTGSLPPKEIPVLLAKMREETIEAFPKDTRQRIPSNDSSRMEAAVTVRRYMYTRLQPFIDHPNIPLPTGAHDWRRTGTGHEETKPLEEGPASRRTPTQTPEVHYPDGSMDIYVGEVLFRFTYEEIS